VAGAGIEVGPPRARERAGQDPGAEHGQALVPVDHAENLPGQGEDPKRSLQMSLFVELEAPFELHLRAGGDSLDQSFRGGVRPRALANNAEDRAEPKCRRGLRSGARVSAVRTD
jgi:hypothetical protein